MRHFFYAGPVTTLPFGVGLTAVMTSLIASAGSTHGALTGLLGACCGAVAITAITVTANNYGGVAGSA
jgi:hypothetical protein